MRAPRLLLAALLVPLGLLVAATARGADDLDAQVKDLGDADGTRRIAAYNALRNARDPRAIPKLVAAAPSYDPLGRYYMALVLDAYPAKESLAAWRQLMRQEDPFLRLAAGTALHQAGEKRGLGLVVEALETPVTDPMVLTYMFNRLYALRERAVDAAVARMLVVGAEMEVLSGALYVLHVHEAREAKAAVLSLLEDERPSAQALASAWLLRFGDGDQVARLAGLLEAGGIESSHFFRLETYLTASGHLDAKLLDALTKGLEREQNPFVLARMVALLGKFGHAPALGAIQRLLAHENETVARAAYEAWAAFAGDADAAGLRDLLAAKDPSRRLWAAEALRRADDASGLPVVLEVLKGSDAGPKAEAVRVLGGFRRPEVIPVLIDALLDPAPSVRSLAQSALLQVLGALYPYRRFDLEAAGYAYAGDEASRKAAVQRIRQWWEGRKDADW